MLNLADFARAIEEKLRDTSREPHWGGDETERYMREIGSRRQHFLEIASSLSSSVIQPRLEILAGYFSNANLSRDEPIGHSACRFGYCERFPVNARVAFAVEHDVAFENLSVHYEATVTPAIVKFDEQDRLSIALDDQVEVSVAEWVQQRLLSFLSSYLRIDRGQDDFEDEVVTDPVCGMRISRAAAVASQVYRGHPYFFCSTDCQNSFSQTPTEFAQAEPTIDG